MNQSTSRQVFGPAINRIADVMEHTEQYAFLGVGRLARDAGITGPTVSRIIHGSINPSALLMARMTAALERAVGRPLDPRELLAENGLFPTKSVCALVGCKGCLPQRAFDEFGDLKKSYTGVEPGAWITSRYPFGLDLLKGGI